MKRLIIFDMDGVLVDSEPLYRSMNKAFLKDRGYNIIDSEYDRYIGIHAGAMWKDLKEKAGLEETVEALIATEKEAKATLLRTIDLKPVNGMNTLLTNVRSAGFLMAVASSSLRSNVDLVLEKLAIRHFFDHTIAGNEVVHGKPDPEIFVKAASHLDVAPQQCVVIEDSSNGILAARHAGMFAVGYQSPASGNQDLSSAHLIIEDLGDLTTAMFPS
ncbi:MAG: HAD family phosphatase [Bacteroidetes bacterium]|nr:HAD family phosphatase [Bacteroidota bacterium]